MRLSDTATHGTHRNQPQDKCEWATIKSFLYYVPYVTLAVMTFPAILESTNSVISAAIAFVIAIVLAWMGKSLFQVAIFSCAAVFIVELLMRFIAG